VLEHASKLEEERVRYLARIKELTEQSNYLYGLGQEYDRQLADCRQAYLRLEALARSVSGWRDMRHSEWEKLADWQRKRLEAQDVRTDRL
jgi:primosomal protein N''